MNENNKYILEAENINKHFEGLHIIKDVSLKIKSGEFVVIHGKSGSGKTTLLSLLSGLEKADTGSIILNKNNINNQTEEELAKTRRQQFGFVFQSFNLLSNLTAIENVMLPLLPITKDISNLKNSSLDIMKYIGIDHRKDHLPSKLSGGEKQRVAISRALINNPQILFADEPTGNLDSTTGKAVIDLFLRLKNERKLTIILVTHDQEIVKLADSVIEIKDGEIVC
ncbi:MAG: ABC transporter ATP-binding protein [Oligoflexia bacterium]|nr:ABC transporter ATP-binding protein [Oligoflexia bacterium]